MRRTLAVHSVWILTILLLASIPAWGDPVLSNVEAQALVRRVLAGRTPPAEVGSVREAGQSYEVEVVTPGGSLVDRMLVDKADGGMRSLYGRMLLSFAPASGGGDSGWGMGPLGVDATAAGLP